MSSLNRRPKRRRIRARSIEPLEQRHMFATHLLADINEAPVEIAPFELHVVNDETFFFAQDGLWKTDGVESSLIKELNIHRGVNDAKALGNQLVFVASDVQHGQELWISDGTAEGTRLLKDTMPGETDGVVISDQTFVESDGELYFRVGASRNLWKTDGTDDGTMLVSEDVRGLHTMVTLGDEVYFTSSDGVWKWGSDDRLVSVHNEDLALLDANDSHLFFKGLNEEGKPYLFGSDGSTQDPVALKELPQLSAINAQVVEGTFYFVLPQSQELWTSDGTVDGTIRLAEIQHAKSVFGSDGDQLLLGIDRPPGWIPIGPTENGVGGEAEAEAQPASAMTSALRVAPRVDELWTYSVSTNESNHLTDWTSYELTLKTWRADDTTYFLKNESVWKTDFTEQGTVSVQAGIQASDAVLQNGTLIVGGQGLWSVTDSQASKLPVDFNRTQDSMQQSFGQVKGIERFQEVGDHALFIADFDLYRTDGLEANTQLVKSWLSEKPSNQDLPFVLAPLVEFVASPFLGRAIISVQRSAESRELWISDGTEAGTTKISDHEKQLLPLHRTDEKLYLRTFDGDIFRINSSFEFEQILSLDGVRSQTATPTLFNDVVDGRLVVQSTSVTCGEGLNCEWALEVRAIDTNDDSVELISRPESNKNFLRQVEVPFARIGDSLAYIAATDEQGRAIWTTDGTSEGTQLFWHDENRSPVNVIPHGDRLLVETEGISGNELWTTDGTADGTTLLASDFITSAGREFRTIGDNVVMIVTDTEIGTELWMTDGDDLHRVDIRPGENSSRPSFLTEFEGDIYFVADDGVHGGELWATDGTPENTRLVFDIADGAKSSSLQVRQANPFNLTSLQLEDRSVQQSRDEFFFSATTPEHGRELWRSDGTAGGTELVADIAKGSDSSSPHSLSVVGADLYFSAKGDEGFEPWFHNREQPTLIPGDTNGDGSVTFQDFLILSANFGKPADSQAEGDFDSNGQVDFADFLALSANFGFTRIDG